MVIALDSALIFQLDPRQPQVLCTVPRCVGLSFAHARVGVPLTTQPYTRPGRSITDVNTALV